MTIATNCDDLSIIPVVIFAGGRGARFDHESQLLPKPMIEVAGKPILMHIIDSFAAQGFKRFIIATGYLSNTISGFFRQEGFKSHWRMDSLMSSPFIKDDISVECVYTGEDSHTGERLSRLRDSIGDHRFVMTYGDGLCDVDMRAVLSQHKEKGATVTVTVVHPPGRFGVVMMNGSEERMNTHVSNFNEKPSCGWINGGFMVAEPEFIVQYIDGGSCCANELESYALPKLAANGGLHAYRHTGFWMCMDTRRDREQIEAAVAKNSGFYPWKRPIIRG